MESINWWSALVFNLTVAYQVAVRYELTTEWPNDWGHIMLTFALAQPIRIGTARQAARCRTPSGKTWFPFPCPQYLKNHDHHHDHDRPGNDTITISFQTYTKRSFSPRNDSNSRPLGFTWVNPLQPVRFLKYLSNLSSTFLRLPSGLRT